MMPEMEWFDFNFRLARFGIGLSLPILCMQERLSVCHGSAKIRQYGKVLGNFRFQFEGNKLYIKMFSTQFLLLSKFYTSFSDFFLAIGAAAVAKTE